MVIYLPTVFTIVSLLALLLPFRQFSPKVASLIMISSFLKPVGNRGFPCVERKTSDPTIHTSGSCRLSGWSRTGGEAIRRRLPQRLSQGSSSAGTCELDPARPDSSPLWLGRA